LDFQTACKVPQCSSHVRKAQSHTLAKRDREKKYPPLLESKDIFSMKNAVFWGADLLQTNVSEERVTSIFRVG
jgi:hypothetical protein